MGLNALALCPMSRRMADGCADAGGINTLTEHSAWLAVGPAPGVGMLGASADDDWENDDSYDSLQGLQGRVVSR
jgi:hypothetical protein